MSWWDFIKRSVVGTVVCTVVMMVIGAGALFISGDLRPSEITGSSKIETQHNDSTLSVSVESGHEADGLVLRHPENDDYIVYAEELEPFGGDYQIPASGLRCDGPDYPSTTFNVELVSGRVAPPIVVNIENVEASQQVKLSEEFVKGECTDDSPF